MNLNPELEARLVSLAADHGTSVEAFLQSIVLEKSDQLPARRFNADEWARGFESWADSFPDAPPISDEALTRENLYPDRS